MIAPVVAADPIARVVLRLDGWELSNDPSILTLGFGGTDTRSCFFLCPVFRAYLFSSETFNGTVKNAICPFPAILPCFQSRTGRV
jgi:hypothetical protein